MSDEARNTAAIAIDVVKDSLRVSRSLFNSRDPVFGKLSKFRYEVRKYWQSVTLPYPELAVRLLRVGDEAGGNRSVVIKEFQSRMRRFKDQFLDIKVDLVAAYPRLIEDAKLRLRDHFDPSWIPSDIGSRYGFSWDWPDISLPSYAKLMSPEDYADQARSAEGRFAEAVRMAEDEFTTRFSDLLGSLTSSLTAGKNIRSSHVDNLKGFFEQFRHLNVSSNSELDALVNQAQAVVGSTSATELRDATALRGRIADSLSKVQTQVEELMVSRSTRRLVMD
jgi:hypothetical protein